MALNLKFEPNKVSIDTKGAITAIQKLAEAYMDIVSDRMVEIMRRWVYELGNGSKVMRNDAKAAVREIVHEVTNEYLNYEIGIDEAAARGMSEQFFVRVMVVLHGNQASGPIHAKPGQSTWKKDVNYRSTNVYSRTPYPIPQFDWRVDVSKGVVEMTIKEIEKVFRDMLHDLSEQIPGIVAMHVTGG